MFQCGLQRRSLSLCTDWHAMFGPLNLKKRSMQRYRPGRTTNCASSSTTTQLQHSCMDLLTVQEPLVSAQMECQQDLRV